MAKYDEFDLDVPKIKESAGGRVDEASMMASCLLTICDLCPVSTLCPEMSSMCTATQQDNCSNTCSACHSYCGGVC